MTARARQWIIIGAIGLVLLALAGVQWIQDWSSDDSEQSSDDDDSAGDDDSAA